MFLFYSVHFLKFLVKSQPQRSYKKKVLISKKECSRVDQIVSQSLLTLQLQYKSYWARSFKNNPILSRSDLILSVLYASQFHFRFEQDIWSVNKGLFMFWLFSIDKGKSLL